MEYKIVKSLLHTLIRFPEITLQTRDAHKLRGYFGSYFKEHSPLLHNHYDDGSLRYKYPLVQYKVIDNVPMLVGFNEGARMLTELFLEMKEISIEGKAYPVNTKNISQQMLEAGLTDTLHFYRFVTNWLALNQENFKEYTSLTEFSAKQEKLNKLLTGNILSMFKGLDVWLDGKLLVKGKFRERTVQFKDQPMLAFTGKFVCNAQLPEFAGIGKAVSRGFGTIVKSH